MTRGVRYSSYVAGHVHRLILWKRGGWVGRLEAVGVDIVFRSALSAVGGRRGQCRTLLVAKAEAKRDVGETFEEV